MLKRIKTFLKHQPVAVWACIFITWAALEAFCIFLRVGLKIDDVPLKFPISICVISPHFKYWPMLVVFCVLAWLAIKRLHKMQPAELYIWGVLLICSGNLMQGFDGAFMHPLGLNTQNTDQYYAEAAAIRGSSADWLADFNQNQPYLMTHSRTHPPFAVLIFRKLAGGSEYSSLCSPWLVIVIWVVWVGACVPLLFRIFCALNAGINHAKLLALILAVMPAFNIYSIISLDSMIFFLSLLFFAGIVDIHLRGAKLTNLAFIVISTLCINLLTFGGVFFLGVSFALAILWLVLYGRMGFLAAFLASVATTAALIILMRFYFHYDHVEAFSTACMLEKHPDITTAQQVLLFIESRFEDICEILVMLGLVPLAMLLSAKNRRLLIFNFKNRLNMLALCGISVLLVIFIGGAYKTGETARACMFIYPFIFLLMRNMRLRTLREMYVCCVIQTALMQFMGCYDW